MGRRDAGRIRQSIQATGLILQKELTARKMAVRIRRGKLFLCIHVFVSAQKAFECSLQGKASKEVLQIKGVFMKKFVALLFASMMFVGVAQAHSGGTDDKGCHAGSKPYHCH